MSAEIHTHDTVALLEDLPATHFLTGQPLRLRRGRVGTVVMTHDGSAFEVEFSGPDGRAFALLPVSAEKRSPCAKCWKRPRSSDRTQGRAALAKQHVCLCLLWFSQRPDDLLNKLPLNDDADPQRRC